MTIAALLFEYALPAFFLIFALYTLRRAALQPKKQKMTVESGASPWRQRTWYAAKRYIPAKMPWASDAAIAEQRDVQQQAGWVIERHKRKKDSRLRR